MRKCHCTVPVRCWHRHQLFNQLMVRRLLRGGRHQQPPYMYVSTLYDFRLTAISDSQMKIKIPFFANHCFGWSSYLTLNLSETPYTLSDANKLTQIGCSNLVVLEGFSKQYASTNLTKSNFASGCISFCSDGDETRGGSCPGNGCCEIPLPKGTVFLNASISYLEDQLGNVRSSNHCSYSFVRGRESFAFEAVSESPSDIVTRLSNVEVVLDWRIGTENCSRARHSSGFGCHNNSFCIDADAGVGGYRCSCLRGYEGNPYLHGCQDIDECRSNPCHSTGIFINTPGDYSCECPVGYFGYGGRNGTGCFQVIISHPKLSKLAIGLITGMGLLTLLSISFMLTKFVKKRKVKKRKQKFFKQNGGLLLQQETSVNEGILGNTRVFAAKELEKATDRFNENRILGRGGQGTVYKGMLSDGQIVAVKKSQLEN